MHQSLKDTENQRIGHEKGMKDTQLPVILSLATAITLMLGVIFFPLIKHLAEQPLLIPMSGIDGVWADSVFNGMSAGCRLNQTLMLETELPDSTGATLEASYSCVPGGMLINPDSVRKFIPFKNWAGEQSVPVLTMVRDGDSLPEVLTPLSAEAILSIRNDSVIKLYLDRHTNAMKRAGANMVQYPLWVERKHTGARPDTLYLKRQIDLARHFIERALSKGMIPVLPLPGYAMKNGTPVNQLDSTVRVLLKAMIHKDLPAVLIDSVPGTLMENQGVRYHLQKVYGFTGLIIMHTGRIQGVQNVALYRSGADMLIVSNGDFKRLEQRSTAIMTEREITYLIGRAAHKVLYFKEWTKNRHQEAQDIAGKEERTTDRIAFHYLMEGSGIIRLRDSFNLIPLQQAGSSPYLIHLPEGIGFELFQDRFAFFSDYKVRRYRVVRNIRIDPGSFNIIVTVPGDYPTGNLKNIPGIQEGRVATRSVLIHIGRVDSLVALRSLPAVIHASQLTERTEILLANILFGGVSCGGVLPWDAGKSMPIFTGMKSMEKVRLSVTTPEVAGISPHYLLHIDSIVTEAIRNGAFPGCQVFIALKGEVIYHKSFGETFYGSGKPVTNNHLYDIASVTKAVATTVAMMRMVDQGKMSLRDPLGKFFRDHTAKERDAVSDTLIRQDTVVVKGTRSTREQRLQAYAFSEQINDTLYVITDTIVFTSTRTRNVFRLNMEQLLTHRSGLPPALPIVPFISNFDRRPGMNRFREYFSSVFIKDSATFQVADGMFLYNHYFDTLWARCKAVGVNPAAEYVYSDANMVFVQQAIDSVNKKPIDQFLDREIYKPLGLKHTAFNPLRIYPSDLIIPTANDLRWRRQQVHGYVHDPTAALFGGVAGNAGLFSNAADLGVLLQMILQGGAYGGKRYFSESTVGIFTSRQGGGHRAPGFDMNSGDKAIIAPSASPNSYGHTGFTGTCVWVDPDLDLVYVFLSNRIYPNTENLKINFLKVRQRVHQVVYDALNDELTAPVNGETPTGSGAPR